MPADFTKAVLREHAVTMSGYAFPSSGFSENEGLPLVRIRDLGKTTTEIRFSGRYDPRFVVKNGDLLIGMDGDFIVQRWRGKVALLNQRVCRVEAASALLDQGYLYRLLGPLVALIYRKTPQTTVRHLSTKTLEHATVRLPPLPEQRRIAEILDTVDEAIRKTEEIIAKLEQVKQGLLHDLLTRGIDEQGEVRDPDRHPEQFKDSALGQIPKAWDVSTVEEEFEVKSGITLGPHRRPRNNPWPYLRVANVHRDRLLIDDIAELEATSSELVDRQLAAGDLLVVEGHANPHEIGRCAMATTEVEGFTFQNHLFRLRPRRLDADFALLWMNSLWVQRYWVRESATSSGLNTINRTKLNRVLVPLPPAAEQDAIARSIEGVRGRVATEVHALAKLGVVKEGLMKDLVTGRVRATPS